MSYQNSKEPLLATFSCGSVRERRLTLASLQWAVAPGHLLRQLEELSNHIYSDRQSKKLAVYHANARVVQFETAATLYIHFWVAGLDMLWFAHRREWRASFLEGSFSMQLLWDFSELYTSLIRNTDKDSMSSRSTVVVLSDSKNHEQSFHYCRPVQVERSNNEQSLHCHRLVKIRISMSSHSTVVVLCGPFGSISSHRC